jgi:hypothetical protein
MLNGEARQNLDNRKMNKLAQSSIPSFPIIRVLPWSYRSGISSGEWSAISGLGKDLVLGI